MAPWSDKEECRKDHAFCVQLSEVYDENAALRARVAELERENKKLKEDLAGWENMSDEAFECRGM